MWQNKQQVLPLKLGNDSSVVEKTVHKAVSFDTKSTTYEIDYIPCEFAEDVWYTEMEISALMSENMDVVVEMSLGIISEGEQSTSRGLEHFGRENQKQRQHTITKSVFAVLDEQRRQLSLKIKDPRLIAASYRSSGTKRCQKASLAVALKDENAVKNIIPNDCRRKTKYALLKATSKNLKRIGLALIRNKKIMY